MSQERRYIILAFSIIFCLSIYLAPVTPSPTKDDDKDAKIERSYTRKQYFTPLHESFNKGFCGSCCYEDDEGGCHICESYGFLCSEHKECCGSFNLVCREFSAKKYCFCRANYSWDGFRCRYDAFPNPTTTEAAINAEEQNNNTLLIVLCSVGGFLILCGLFFVTRIACRKGCEENSRTTNSNSTTDLSPTAPEPSPKLTNNSHYDVRKSQPENLQHVLSFEPPPPSYEQAIGNVS